MSGDVIAADWLLRVAFHEAGHAVAAWLLIGGSRSIAGPLTCEPRGGYAGCAYTGALSASAAELARADELPIDAPVALWPARPRRLLEVDAMIYLAAEPAEAYRCWPEPADDASDDSDRIALSSVERRAGRRPLPVREAAMLATTAKSDVANDLAQAYKAARALTGGDSLRDDALVQHWNAEARALIATARARRLLRVLAHELLDAGTLARADVLAVLNRCDGGEGAAA